MALSIRCRRWGLMGAVVALVAGSALAAEVGVNEREILIGQSITLLDGKHAYGTAVAKGVRVYLDRVNAEGGVYGRKINVRRLDDQGDAAQAEANAKKLVGDGVFALFGSLEGGPSNAVLKVGSRTRPRCRSSARWPVRRPSAAHSSRMPFPSAPSTGRNSAP